jgi:predicted PurR-regulated permease PerM
MAERSLTINISARSIVVTLGILALAWAALQIPDVLTMVLVALILASAMYPGARFLMDRYRLPRVAAIAAMFAAVFATLALLAVVVAPSLVQQVDELAKNFPAYVTKVRGSYAWLQGLDARYHVLPDLDDAAKTVSGFAAGWVASTLGWATKLLGGVATLFLTLIITFFVLLDGPDLKKGLLSLAPPEHRPTLDAQFEPVALKLGAYVQGVLMSIGFLTTYLGIALTVAGVPMALALAILAGCFELIPLVGSLLGSIPAILIALTVGWQKALVVVAIFAVGNVIQGNVVAPFVFSKSIEVSPVMILLALLVGANLFGVAGAIIAVPLMAMIQVLIQNLYVEPMEARWAATHPAAFAAPPALPAGDPPAPEA